MYITSFIRCIIDNLAISFYFSLSLNCKIELLNQQIYFSHFLYLRLFFTIFILYFIITFVQSNIFFKDFIDKNKNLNPDESSKSISFSIKKIRETNSSTIL